jgi:hypothetical protein
MCMNFVPMLTIDAHFKELTSCKSSHEKWRKSTSQIACVLELRRFVPLELTGMAASSFHILRTCSASYPWKAHWPGSVKDLEPKLTHNRVLDLACCRQSIYYTIK